MTRKRSRNARYLIGECKVNVFFAEAEMANLSTLLLKKLCCLLNQALRHRRARDANPLDAHQPGAIDRATIVDQVSGFAVALGDFT